MARRINNKQSINKVPRFHHRKPASYRRPFWLPTTSYYFLSFAIAATFFFLIWGILNEGGEQTPWISAGIFSGFILISAVVVREIFLRKARNRYNLARRQLDYNLSKIPQVAKVKNTRPKFTLQQNTFLLNQIEEKSAAARVLNRHSEGHREVSEICNEYLNFTKAELARIDYNSPRFLAVKKGRRRIKSLHKYHLLTWAEIETKKITREAKYSSDFEKKIAKSQKALAILDTAIGSYPNDPDLVASYGAVREFIARTKIANQIEKTESMVNSGDLVSAIKNYENLLYFVTRESINKRDKSEISELIESELQRLKLLVSKDSELEINLTKSEN